MAVRLRLQAYLVAACVLSVTLSTCGIEASVTIYSTPGFSSSGNNAILLTHNTANSETGFLGYEIYYRAFDEENAALSARVAIQDAAALTTATPESCNAQLKAKGFSRIFDDNGEDGPNGNRPLFAIDSSETATTAVSFDILLDNTMSTANWYYKRSTAPDTKVISRSISTAGSAVSFESKYSSSDADYASGTKSDTIYFVFFAVAYGVDTVHSGSFGNIYSLPISLYKEFPYTLPQ
jgi:hypothetical protein